MLQTEENSRCTESTSQFLCNICSDIDPQHSGMTIEKVIEGFEKYEDFRSFLRRMCIDREDLQCMFGILDASGSGAVSHDHFTEQLLQMQVHSNDSVLKFIRLHTAKSQQKLEDQLIWFEQRRSAAAASKDDAPQKTPSTNSRAWGFETENSIVAKSKPVVRTVTPFATQSEYNTSGSLPAHEATLSFGEIVGKLKDFGDPLEEKMQSQPTSTTRKSPPNVAIVSELDALRRQIDAQLEAMQEEFSRGTLYLATVSDDNTQGSRTSSPIRGSEPATESADGPANRFRMPLPDIAITPPPVSPSEICAQQGKRSGSPAPVRRGNKGSSRPAPLPPLEEVPKSGSLSSWRNGLEQAAGISCCETSRAPTHRLATVGPV